MIQCNIALVLALFVRVLECILSLYIRAKSITYDLKLILNRASFKNSFAIMNGVSPSMWDSKEWFDYLESKLGIEVLNKYHPPKTTTVNALEEFFG